MPALRCRDAERVVQHAFRKSSIFSSLALSLMVLATAAFLRANRPSLDLSAATFEVRWAPVRVPPTEGLQAKIAGAWALTALDPRAGGFSGLAVDGDRLLGLTDGGMLVWLPIPPASGRATIRPLPAVAGNPRTKIGRDSEAIARAADGWWVAFEQKHRLVRYDPAFARASRRIAIRHRDFRPNRGAEAIVAGSRLIAYPESSGISDAAVTSDGEIALLKRRFGV